MELGSDMIPKATPGSAHIRLVRAGCAERSYTASGASQPPCPICSAD